MSGVRELPHNAVVADTAEARLGFQCERWVTDENNVAIGLQHIPAPFGEPALQTDVDSSAQMPCREVGRLAGVEQDCAGVAQPEHLVEVQRVGRTGVEQRPHFAVPLDLELEVVRLDGLTLGDHRDEGILRHRSQRVVGLSLFAECRARLARQLLSAR